MMKIKRNELKILIKKIRILIRLINFFVLNKRSYIKLIELKTNITRMSLANSIGFCYIQIIPLDKLFFHL